MLAGVRPPWHSGWIAYNCNDSIGLEQVAETLKELECEEIDRFHAAGKDIMDDVVVCFLGFDKTSCVADSIRNHRLVVLLEIKVPARKLMYNRINLHHCGVNTMRDESRRRRPNSKSTIKQVSQDGLSCTPSTTATYISNAVASLSATLSRDSTSLTASSIAKTP